jgi:hypothetical protein
MPTTLVNITPTVINVRVRRGTTNVLRATIYENSVPADLTGDTVTMLVKDRPGGTVRLNITGVLEPQSGATLGQLLLTLPAAQLQDGDNLIDPIEWVYELRRLHGGQPSVPIEGLLLLSASI